MTFKTVLATAGLLLASVAAHADVALLMRPDVQRYIDEQVASGELTRAELEAWRQNLKGLALRFRESLTEW